MAEQLQPTRHMLPAKRTLLLAPTGKHRVVSMHAPSPILMKYAIHSTTANMCCRVSTRPCSLESARHTCATTPITKVKRVCVRCPTYRSLPSCTTQKQEKIINNRMRFHHAFTLRVTYHVSICNICGAAGPRTTLTLQEPSPLRSGS